MYSYQISCHSNLLKDFYLPGRASELPLGETRQLMLRAVCYCKVEQEVNQAHLLCKWIRPMDPPTIEPLKAVRIVHLLISFVPYLTYIISFLTLDHILLSYLPAMTSLAHKIIQTAKLLWRMAMYIVKRLVEKLLLVQNVHSLTIMSISEMFKIQIHSLIMPEKTFLSRNQSAFEERIIYFDVRSH